jgi:hypothetical protein
MRVLLLLAFVPQLLSAVPMSGPQTTYKQAWKSDAYVEQQFPSVWRPADVRSTERDFAAYRRYRPTAISIRDVVTHFGLPDRFLVSPSRPGVRWLIYDFPDGSAVGFYLPVNGTEDWGTGVVLDSAGRLLEIIRSEHA